MGYGYMNPPWHYLVGGLLCLALAALIYGAGLV
jgi:hypothetical protein